MNYRKVRYRSGLQDKLRSRSPSEQARKAENSSWSINGRGDIHSRQFRMKREPTGLPARQPQNTPSHILSSWDAKAREIKRNRAMREEIPTPPKTTATSAITAESCETKRLGATMRKHFVPLAQLDRASASGAEGCGFDPRGERPFKSRRDHEM
jgi:hypothetical protein